MNITLKTVVRSLYLKALKAPWTTKICTCSCPKFNAIAYAYSAEPKVILKIHHVPRTLICKKWQKSDNSSKTGMKAVIYFGLSFLGLWKEKDKESELITTIKRSVLLIQKEEHKKAEQMLHVALKLAQEQLNHDAIVYIYDMLANLAYEQHELDKAEKLFVSVMQNLLAKGAAHNDNRMIHISLKLAHIYQMKQDTRNIKYQKQLEKSEVATHFWTKHNINSEPKLPKHIVRKQELATWEHIFIVKNRNTSFCDVPQKDVFSKFIEPPPEDTTSPASPQGISQCPVENEGNESFETCSGKNPKKADEGFNFCVKNLKKKIDDGNVDEDTSFLWAMCLDWYARFLMEQKQFKEALSYFEKAYNLSLQMNGLEHEETVMLLNDLGTVCFETDDVDGALSYLTKAYEAGNKLADMEEFAAVLVNLGNVYMSKGMYKEAKHLFDAAWKNAKKHNNLDALKEINTCLDQLKLKHAVF